MTIGAQRVMMPQRVAASEPAKIERSALRVQRAPSVQTSVEIEPSSLKAEKERISDATQTSGSTSALAEIKALINDQLWSNRYCKLLSFELILAGLQVFKQLMIDLRGGWHLLHLIVHIQLN